MSLEQSVSQHASETAISLHSPETLPGESASAILVSIFERASSDAHVAITHGYGAQIRVERSQLVIRDGIGRHRRERIYAKTDRMLKRIIITASSGFVSLEAYRWLAEHDIAVTMLAPHGELVSAWSTEQASADSRLIRRQALAVTDGTATDIARELLSRKVCGQADTILKHAGDSATAAKLYRYAERMADSENITQTRHQDSPVASLSELEGWAARDYFASWNLSVNVKWNSSSESVIAEHWRSYPGRLSLVSGGARKQFASDPVNAMLNFAYTVAESEARTACIAHGLDPRLGFIHADKPGRDSLALDILEVIRPEVDDFILSMVSDRTFSYRQFSQPYGLPAGTCRLVAPLTHDIAEQAWRWSKPAMDAAQLVVSMLSGSNGKRGDHTHNLMRVKASFQAELVSVDDILPAKLYDAVFADIVPAWPRKTFRPPMPDRTVIAAMIHCDRNHRPYSHVPGSLGISHRTITDRRRQWQRLGCWPQIRKAIDAMLTGSI